MTSPNAPHSLTAATAPTFETLEGRKLLDASPVTAGKTDVLFQSDADGTRANRDIVVVNFTDEINVDRNGIYGPEESNSFNIVGYGVNPISGRQKKILAPVTDVYVNPDDRRQLYIETSTITDKFSRIYIYGDLVTDNNGDTIEVTPANYSGRNQIITEKGASKWRYTLAQRQFRPFVDDYFNRSVFNDAEAPGSGITKTEAEYRADMNFILRERRDNFGTVTDADIADANERFDGFGKLQIPDPAIRAGLLSNYGTVGEDAIYAIMDGANDTGRPWTIVAFDGERSADVVVAETVRDEGRMRTLIRDDFVGENFLVWGAVLAHEAMHQDFVNTQTEEIIANAAEAFVWFQHLETYGIAGRTQTTLVNELNTALLGLMNSGDAQFPRVGLRTAPMEFANNIYVGGTGAGNTNQPNIVEELRREYADRNFGQGQPPMNDYALKVVEAITGVDRNDFPNLLFSEGVIDVMDLEQDVISDPGAIRVAGELKLIYFAV